MLVLVLAGLQTRLFDFAALKVPQVEKPHAILLVLFKFRDASANLLPVCESRGYVLQLDSGVSVQQLLPRRAVEVYDGFVLRVDHRQVRRNLLEHGHGRGLVIDEDPALAARSNLAPQDQRAILRVILRVQAVGLEDPFNGTRGGSITLKHRGDDCPLRTRPDHIRGRLVSQK